jgi:hypothetical protein
MCAQLDIQVISQKPLKKKLSNFDEFWRGISLQKETQKRTLTIEHYNLMDLVVHKVVIF